ncbi:MAG TPA: hypothetical protein VEU72_09410 [Nitrosopumilaceae archaeon]|nr:hypothetical protein [Nitrosopumilaceae archaeon]
MVNKDHIHVILQLEEARIGDHDRLESIKNSLNTGQELPESDKKYIEEQAAQLKKAIEHQMLADWAMDFVKNLREKEKETSSYRIDKEFLEQASTKLRNVIESEKEIKWTQTIISQLKEAKIGDAEKLNHISIQLKSGKNIEEMDKQYLREKEMHLRQIIDCKTKVTLTQVASKKLQEREQNHSKKIERIIHAIENGNQVSNRDLRYLNARYEKLQSALDLQNRTDWTISTIQKLKEHGVGDFARLDEINQLLEDEIPVPENDVKYLKEEYKILKQMLDHKKRIEQTISMVNELQEIEIGNCERLSEIKLLLQQGKPVPEFEIKYLANKYRLLMIVKSQENRQGTVEIDFNSILNELRH